MTRTVATEKPKEGNGERTDRKAETVAHPITATRIEGTDRRVFDVHTLAETVDLDEGDRCDDLLSGIVACAETGDTIRFRDGVFALYDLHIIETSLIIEAENAILDFGDSGGLHFRGSHYNGASPHTSTQLSQPIRKGDHRINTEETSGFSDGEYILIETGYSGWSDQHPLREGSEYRCQVTKIESISGSRLVLDRAIQTCFDTEFDGGRNSIEIHRLDPLEKPVFRDLKTVGGEIPLRMESCIDGRFENCEVTGYENYGHRIDYCLGTVHDRPVITAPRGRGPAQGEALQIAHSTDTTINNPRIHTCRRGINFANGVFGVEINDPHITDVSMQAISIHGKPATVGNVHVFDGPDDEHDQHGDASDLRGVGGAMIDFVT